MFYRSAKELWVNFGLTIEKVERLNPETARGMLSICDNFSAGERSKSVKQKS
jgi:hypothetical protein